MGIEKEFDDPLDDIDPIMEEAFSTGDDDFDPFADFKEELGNESKQFEQLSGDRGTQGSPKARQAEPSFEKKSEQESPRKENKKTSNLHLQSASEEESDPHDSNPNIPLVSDVQFPHLEEEDFGKRYEPSVFSNIPVNVSVELGRSKISLKEIFELSEGAIIELERMVGEPLDLVVNGQVVAQGEVVAIDNNYGLRVTGIKSDN